MSKWTWAATLLQSSNVAFQFGISGPFWYAAGATIQVLLFAVLAVEIKRKDLRAIKAIGAGQFGKVYLAVQQDSQGKTNQRAVKMLRTGASAADKAEFIAEAETMLAIGRHSSIVSLLGVCATQRPWLVVLEFCQYGAGSTFRDLLFLTFSSGDLADVLQACRSKKVVLTLSDQLYYAEQLASAVGYIASKRFVHMDIALRNCLLDSSNVLKLADFGLARKYDEGQNTYRQHGVMKLSIRWLAIDSYEGKLFSEGSDMWSFAVTVWELLSYGEQPFKDSKLLEVLRRVRGGERLACPPKCPDHLYGMLLECWNADRKRRPTAGVVCEACVMISTMS